jgi:hypothetical protein
MAVPRWQRDLKDTLWACYPSTIQQVRLVPKHPELWYSLCILPHRKAFALARIQKSSALRNETVNSVHTLAVQDRIFQLLAEHESIVAQLWISAEPVDCTAWLREMQALVNRPLPHGAIAGPRRPLFKADPVLNPWMHTRTAPPICYTTSISAWETRLIASTLVG